LIKVKKITESDLLETVFKIRKTVFVEEQQVKASDEFDTYEESSHHFLAYYNGIPCAGLPDGVLRSKASSWNALPYLYPTEIKALAAHW